MRWQQRLSRPGCRLAQDAGSRLQAAPQTCSLTFSSRLPAPGSYFFLFLPTFVLLGLIVTSFGQARGVCIEG